MDRARRARRGVRGRRRRHRLHGALRATTFVAAAGGVDLVFANAGVGIANRVLEGESREIAWLMNVNVVGVTNTVVPFVPQMVKQGSGVLCAVGSMAGPPAAARARRLLGFEGAASRPS